MEIEFRSVKTVVCLEKKGNESSIINTLLVSKNVRIIIKYIELGGRFDTSRIMELNCILSFLLPPVPVVVQSSPDWSQGNIHLSQVPRKVTVFKKGIIFVVIVHKKPTSAAENIKFWTVNSEHENKLSTMVSWGKRGKGGEFCFPTERLHGTAVVMK
jgi:hypothetical protein